MTSEHNTGVRLILRIGQQWNKQVITLPNWHGPATITPTLLDAIRAELNRRHHGSGWTTFDHIEIIGEEKS